MEGVGKPLGWVALGLGTAVSLFYLTTLAPTVLWGDDAAYQYAAFSGLRQPDGSNHWLWLMLAQAFVQLPLGDLAYRVNLLSAVAAVGTVLLLLLAARTVGLSVGGAVVTAVSLSIAHTFWTHAVRAEVYTLFTLLMTAQLWLWFRWQRENTRPLYAALALWGVSLLAHQMAVLLLPALAVLLWGRRRWLTRRQWGYGLLAGSGGVLFFLLIVSVEVAQVADVDLLTAVWLYFTHSSTNFGGAMLDYSLTQLGRDLFYWLGFLGLQFVGLAGILGLVGMVQVWRKRTQLPTPLPWAVLGVLYLTCVAFAFSYRVNDQYVFYLPSYVAFSFFIGAGWSFGLRGLLAQRPYLAPLILFFILAVPLTVYAALPRTLNYLALNPLGIRELPHREPNRFFLWPGKQGYTGAATYGRAALQATSPHAVLLADHTPYETLRYLQQVEGIRPDVVLIKIEPAGLDLAPIVAQLPPETAVYLADNNPDYYNLRQIKNGRLAATPPIYRLIYNTAAP
jgi:hypothetical protein